MNDTRILIVDDDSDILTNMVDILTDLGYSTDTAGDGESALRLLEANSYDVALLDLKMPGISGLELHQQIRKRFPRTAAFLITAFAGDGIAEDAIRSGVLRVFRKPLDLPEIIPRIEQALNRSLVLVVDQDSDFSSQLQQQLQDRGFRVVVSFDEQDAVDRLRSVDYDIVVLDVDTHGVNANRIVAAMREKNPEARAFVLTGIDSTDPAVQNLLSEGVIGVCTKPVDVQTLLHQLDNNV